MGTNPLTAGMTPSTAGANAGWLTTAALQPGAQLHGGSTPPPVPASDSPGADANASAGEDTSKTGEKAVPGSSFFGRLAEMVNQHPLTLMALGAGMAGAPSLGTGISRGLAAATPAMGQDLQRQMVLGGAQARYKAWVANGAPASEALAGVYDPKKAEQLDATFGTQAPQIKTVKDPATGRDITVQQDGRGNLSIVNPGQGGNVPNPSGAQAQPAKIAPPPEAVRLLRMNPTAYGPSFDQKYGAGSAQQYGGGP